MTSPLKGTQDLARAVATELRRREKGVPALPILRQLFDTLYFASLKTEEAQPTFCYLVYLDPDNPHPAPSEYTPKDLWSCIELASRIPFTVASLVKIAKASDPRTSSFAVYHDSNGKLFIWGLVDQGNRFHEFINFNSERAPQRPGVFQAAILGIGHLAAFRGYTRIAELHIDSLIIRSHDVLRYGPIAERLRPGIREFVLRVHEEFVGDEESDDSRLPNFLDEDWIATICRLLLRIRGYRHGGALLITPDAGHEDLDIKYGVRYDRLKQALIHRAVHRLERDFAEDEIAPFMEESTDADLPIGLYLNESLAQGDLEESLSELDSAIWFVSLLSRVDGLVLLTPHLEVLGFGVEILQQAVPPSVLLSNTARATPTSLEKAEYLHYGTRHRSMMRYCYSAPGSVGFVVSQDGDVRVMTRIDEDLVIWDSIRLQLDQFVRQRSRSSSQRPRSRRTPQG